jgi:SAM-dependent methyltransferase
VHADAVDYDALWRGEWGGMQDLGPVHRHTARMIGEEVRRLRPASIIDVGCGNGANLVAIHRAEPAIALHGLDISHEAIDVARARVPDATFEVLDVRSGRTPEASYDLVLSSQVIEHVPDDDAFLRMVRALCAGYCFIGTMQGRMRRSEERIGHLRNYTRAGLVEKIERAGFAVERVIEWGFPFYSPVYRSLIELIGGQTAKLSYGARDRAIASMLYQLYRLNMSTRGDVLMIVGRAV